MPPLHLLHGLSGRALDEQHLISILLSDYCDLAGSQTYTKVIPVRGKYQPLEAEATSTAVHMGL